jgi:hypothetical protein
VADDALGQLDEEVVALTVGQPEADVAQKAATVPRLHRNVTD